jgi:hypothetical protein
VLIYIIETTTTTILERKNKTPEYTLRAVRKYSKVHKERINEHRKFVYFCRFIQDMLEEEDMTNNEKLYFITIKKNYELYKETPKVVELLAPLLAT